MQKAKRLLAMISAIIITTVFCVMPVSATVPVPTGETYELYDTVGYDDLYIGTTSMAGRTMNGGRNYTYNATAPTYSAVFSFRWIPRGNENDLKFTVFFDDWVYPFCFAAKAPNQSGFGKTAGPNGAWHIVPSDGSLCVDMKTPIVSGQPYDMEMGRLKVKTGANAGKYYVYWKVNGELVQSYYYAGVSGGVYGNGTALSNKIIFSASDANYFTAVPFTEAYDDYDEIGLDDLYVGEDSLAGRTLAGGDYTCTYRATSPSFSSVLKFRWIPGGALTRFSMYFDAFAYPFCFAVKSPNQTGFGAVPGPNGAWHLVPSNGNLMVNMSEPIAAGNPYDMEMGRLKVMNGSNAGKYYVYWKVNGTLIQSYYYDGVAGGTYGSGTALSNKIIIQLPNGNKFTAISSAETYAAYDEIEYEDLCRDGVRVGEQTQMAGAMVFTYNRTSPTGSAVFRFRLRVGSVAKLQMSFEKTNASTMACVFGAWLEPDGQYPNGRMWLRPGYGPQTNLPALLEPYSTHNVEFARLRVNSGANNGKYLVYIKIDGVTVATDYVDAAVVDENLQYTSEPNHTACDINSNEIFFAFWGSEGNIISAYQDENPYAHQGIRGDFNENTAIDSVDLVALKAVLLGTEECDETADFNNDNTADVRDLVAMKRHLAPAKAHERSGRLVVGIQEHLEEDATKTAAYIAEASATLGARSYRLSMPIHYMFRPTVSGGVEIRYEHLNRFREMVRQLKANGIDEILYVSSGFVEPYGYDDPLKTHGSTVPDPIKEPENYQNWLQVNAAAYWMLAQEFPELKYFEPFNEINVDEGSGLEKYGVNMQSSAEEHATHKYTVEERAGIMADLCWYISRAVKSVDRANQVTTPSISFNIVSHVESDFLEAFYNCMESGVYPRGQRCGDINTNNYFTVLNIHSYKGYSPTNADVDGWVAEIDGMYDVVRRHNDTAKPVWMTETGCADSAGRDRVGENIVGALQAVETRLPYIDTVHIYKLANASNKGGAVVHETNYGLFCSGDDAVNPYGIKNSTKIVYSYLHNGSTDYSPLYALANRYAG